MTKKEIAHLAELGKLEIDEKGLEQFGKEFEGILKFVSQIENAKIEEETEGQFVLFKSLREDEVRTSLVRAEIFKNTAKSDGEYFVVPKVVEDED